MELEAYPLRLSSSFYFNLIFLYIPKRAVIQKILKIIRRCSGFLHAIFQKLLIDLFYNHQNKYTSIC